MRRLALATVVVLLALVPTGARGHSEQVGPPPLFCGHGSIIWQQGVTPLSEVFNYHPSTGRHNVTVYVWSRTSRVWVVVHRHTSRSCPH